MPDLVDRDVRRPPPILALGFRPFFLAAGVWALLAVPLWLAVLWGWLPAQPYYQGTAWHAHSLLFGYGMVVIAGFLLTATRNWTGMDTATGMPLAGLVVLWLAGRVLPWLPVPGALIASLDVAFPIVLALSLRRPLWSGPNPVNRVFLALLFGMALAALLVHLDVSGVLPGGALVGDRLMLDLVVGTLLLVAGRVLPFFTRSAVPGAAPVSRPWVETLTFGLWGLWTLGDATARVPELTGAVALALAVVALVRVADWHHAAVWRIPILAVLYAGALWLILGIGLNGLAHLGLLPPFPALHALTIGAIGVFTLGMMSRVTLGHTGRPMVAPPAMVLAFWALNLAALTRVAGPLVWPAAYGGSLLVSGTLWGLAFGLFLWVHGPMLIGPRADGRPG